MLDFSTDYYFPAKIVREPEIVAWVFGKRNYKTARELRNKIKSLGVSYDSIAIDEWKSFKKAFRADVSRIGKEFTKGLKGTTAV